MGINSSVVEYKFGQVYHLGIIDFLQNWNFIKKGEHHLKRLKPFNDYRLISAVWPELYKQRYQEFMKKQVLKP